MHHLSVDSSCSLLLQLLQCVRQSCADTMKSPCGRTEHARLFGSWFGGQHSVCGHWKCTGDDMSTNATELTPARAADPTRRSLAGNSLHGFEGGHHEPWGCRLVTRCRMPKVNAITNRTGLKTCAPCSINMGNSNSDLIYFAAATAAIRTELKDKKLS